MPRQPASDQQWSRLRTDIGRLLARRVANDADREDVVQDVLVRVWRYGSALRDHESFGAWLSRVTRTAVADHLRRKERHVLLPREPDLEPPAPSVEPPAESGARPVSETIAAVLRPFVGKLSPAHREVITLSELDGLPHAAIAEKLALSVSGVKSRVQRGREQLRKLIERCCEVALDARGGPVACVLRPDAILPDGCCGSGDSCVPSAVDRDRPPS